MIYQWIQFVKKLHFWYSWKKKFNLFLVLILQIFRGKSNVIVREVSRNLKTSMNALVGR